MKFAAASNATLFLFAVCTVLAYGQSNPQHCQIAEIPRGAHLTSDAGVIDFEILRANLLRVDVQLHGKSSPRTLMMDPALKASADLPVAVHREGNVVRMEASGLQASITCAPRIDITVFDGVRHQLVEQVDPFGEASWKMVDLLHQANENLYGMSGLSMHENGGGLIRNHGAAVAAGVQGEAGAPWFFTTHFGVLIDSDGGGFDTRDGEVRFYGDSRDDVEYFVMAGRPMDVMGSLADLTGHPPLPPKWTLGFINSQWGSSEDEIKKLTATYREKHIPIDAFIMDYDWKAWGEDNYGEWRWNSTSSPENGSPNKFPDGESGEFAQEMRAQGIKLAGILKPRILLYKKGSTTQMHEAAAYAQEHDLWYPGERQSADNLVGQPARNLDFSKAETRAWFWKHLEPAFDAGMAAWWNDEADYANNFQFFNMGRALYEGQRGHSNLREWSINRNFYLGAQRYSYAEWSGDIQTGFQNMAHQRMRMLSTLDVGEPHWSMDTGGFFGHPTPENYARWMEFAAFVPIDRVHGDNGEKRQPWVYGPVAEAAATKAIRLRYELLPYIYSYERITTETGVGVVRPLFWAFPEDAGAADEGSAWMFGDGLLVSPVVTRGETEHSVYLPSGVWYDYFRGTKFLGGEAVKYKVDPQTWEDVPLFVREGAILASEAPQEYMGQHPVEEVTLDVYPAKDPSRFIYYDDDGMTYAYEQGAYYRQAVTAQKTVEGTHVDLDKPTGSFQPALRRFLVRVHGAHATVVTLDGTPLSKVSPLQQQSQTEGSQWSNSVDRFGALTTIRIPATHATSLLLR